MSDKIRPFSCGTQYVDWTDANCRRCVKGADPDSPPARCPCDIEQALLEAYFDEGKVSLPIAQRMGVLSHEGHYNWKCGEWEPVVQRKENT